jgi:insertion element IS1 protein InsB
LPDREKVCIAATSSVKFFNKLYLYQCPTYGTGLWYAIDHKTGKLLAYVLGDRKDTAFLKLKKLLESFGITHFYTDDWGAYERHIEPEKHIVGKENTQKIERKNLTFRTRIKRLVRKTICFSKKILMHDIVIGLFINRYEFAGT